MATHTVAYHKDRVEYKDYIEGDSKRAASNRENVKVAIKNYIKSSFIKEENYSLTELFLLIRNLILTSGTRNYVKNCRHRL